MIIVEGPDGAGKSTLVAAMASRFGLELGERSTTDRDNLYEYTVRDSYQALVAEVFDRAKGNPPIVWDRMFYSDPIYASIVREEETRFTEMQITYLHNLVVALRIPVWICLPPIETVQANVMEGHQLAGVVDNITDIYEAYQELVEHFPGNHPLYVYDYTIRGSLPRQLSRVRTYIRGREATFGV